MSRFLRVGMIADRVQDIIEASSILLKDLDSLGLAEKGDSQKVKERAQDIYSMALDLKEFISRWDSEPIIYTGRGTTDEIISMLDHLLAKAEKVSYAQDAKQDR